MRLFLFRGFGTEAGLRCERIGWSEEGAVGWAEVQVVNLTDLGPDGVQVANLVRDFAGFGMSAGLVEALQRPEEGVGGSGSRKRRKT